MAKGGRGGKRGGKGNGVDMSQIISTSSLISAREEKGNLVDQALKTFQDAEGEYGTIVDDIQLAVMGKKEATTMAYYDGANIAVNVRYFEDSINDVYDNSVSSGFHPGRGDKTGLQAVIAHEIGHKITDQVGEKLGNTGLLSIDKTATTIVKEALKQTGHKGVVQMAKKISDYATYSNAEAVAEAYADVYCNGSKAHKESIAIMNVVNKYLKK